MLPALLFVAAGFLAGEDRAREIRLAFGTFAEIRVSGVESPERALVAAFERIDEVERSLSTWREDSEVSRLNRTGEAVVSEDLLSALRAALEIGRDSNGAFDVTLEPLGFRRIAVEEASRRVRLDGVELDLGAIAKGYAVDAALDLLEGWGAKRALVDFGTSSIGLFGDEPVTFEIRHPEGGPPPASFSLCRGAVSSSSRDQAGSHIRDPRTGGTAESLLAVTVVAESSVEADALSTAVFVLGAREGLALLERRGASGVVLFQEGGRLVLRATRGFAEAFELVVGEGVSVR